MSEHRRTRPITTRHDYAALAKMLHEPCHDWPRCICGTKWSQWPKYLDEINADDATPLTVDELADAAMDIVAMLACASKHAPSRRIRIAAAIELAHPLLRDIVAGVEPHAVIAKRMEADREEAEREAAEAEGEADPEPPLDHTMFAMGRRRGRQTSREDRRESKRHSYGEERRQVMSEGNKDRDEDRKAAAASTYLAQAQAEAERCERFAKQSPAHVTGAEAMPALPMPKMRNVLSANGSLGDEA